jgi:hypothetical protein
MAPQKAVPNPIGAVYFVKGEQSFGSKRLVSGKLNGSLLLHSPISVGHSTLN